MSEDIIQVLIQGGAVGLALGLIIYSAWKDKLYNKTLNNHLNHLSDTLTSLTSIIDRINENHKNIRGVLDTNTRMVGDNMKLIERITGFLNGKGYR